MQLRSGQGAALVSLSLIFLLWPHTFKGSKPCKQELSRKLHRDLKTLVDDTSGSLLARMRKML